MSNINITISMTTSRSTSDSNNLQLRVLFTQEARTSNFYIGSHNAKQVVLVPVL